MSFRITGLSPEPFQPSSACRRMNSARGASAASPPPASPASRPHRDARARAGETVLLLNHMSQPAHSPYRATHAIYVREGASDRYDRVGEVPDIMRSRLLSLRAFDAEGMMVDGDVVDGSDIERVIARMLGDPGPIISTPTTPSAAATRAHRPA